MSILGTVFLKDGIIMSSDSRLTATKTINGVEQTRTADRLPKTFLVSDINVGISYCGNVRVNGELFHDFIEHFVENEIDKSDTVCTVAKKIYDLTNRKGTIFVICGYVDCVPYVYCVYGDSIVRVNVDDNDEVIYSRLILGGSGFPEAYYDANIKGKFMLSTLSLENGITLAENLVTTAIQNTDSCGNPINTLVIKSDKAEWHKRHFACEDLNIN